MIQEEINYFVDNFKYFTAILLLCFTSPTHPLQKQNIKLLGTIIFDDLSWDLNTKNLIKRANARMELLRKVASFGAPVEDLKVIYILFISSLLEQSATVWHSSLTRENSDDLERVQKSALKIILGNRYYGYKKALNQLDLESLEDRREVLCLKFARKCLKNKKTQHLFPLNAKKHQMKTREPLKCQVQHANTERLRKSALIYMQNLLN